MPGFLLEHLTFPDLPVSVVLTVPDLDKATHPDLCQSQSPQFIHTINTERISRRIYQYLSDLLVVGRDTLNNV